MIKINELTLQEVAYKYEGNTLYLEFDVEELTLQELEEHFSLNENTVIEQYENELLINKWYYKEFQSIGYEKTTSGWHIKMSLVASCFYQNDLNLIYNLINQKQQAITSITESVNLLQTQVSNILRELSEVNQMLSQNNDTNDDNFVSIQSGLTRLENNYVTLVNRIAQLENNVNNIKINATTTTTTTADNSNNNTNSHDNDSNTENTDTNVEDYDTSDNIEDDEFLDNDNN